MKRDAREPAHTEAGPLWFTVQISILTSTTGRPLRFAKTCRVAVQQPVTDARIRRVAMHQYPATIGRLRPAFLQNGDRTGLLLGDRCIMGQYVILDPGRVNR